MTPKEKARQLFELHKDYVHGYIGSSMLTNTEYPEQIISQAKKAAAIGINELIKEAKTNYYTVRFKRCKLSDREYWQAVLNELERIDTLNETP